MDTFTMKHLWKWIENTVPLSEQEETMQIMVNYFNKQDKEEQDRLCAYSWRQIYPAAMNDVDFSVAI